MIQYRSIIYISGAMMAGTNGNHLAIEQNVRLAMNVGKLLRDKNIIPYIPHLNWYWKRHIEDNLKLPFYSEEECLEMDFCVIARCDGLYRMPGESHGGDLEVSFAREIEKPVFFSIEKVIELYAGK